MIEPEFAAGIDLMAPRVSLSAMVTPELKAVLQRLAEKDRRSMSSMLEILIERAGIEAGLYQPPDSTDEDKTNDGE